MRHFCSMQHERGEFGSRRRAQGFPFVDVWSIRLAMAARPRGRGVLAPCADALKRIYGSISKGTAQGAFLSLPKNPPETIPVNA